MTNKNVWMGVDLGNARVGIALSDPDLLLAHPEDIFTFLMMLLHV